MDNLSVDEERRPSSEPVAEATAVLWVPPSPVAAPDGSTFSVIAFVQERASRRVLAAATAPLARR